MYWTLNCFHTGAFATSSNHLSSACFKSVPWPGMSLSSFLVRWNPTPVDLLQNRVNGWNFASMWILSTDTNWPLLACEFCLRYPSVEKERSRSVRTWIWRWQAQGKEMSSWRAEEEKSSEADGILVAQSQQTWPTRIRHTRRSWP